MLWSMQRKPCALIQNTSLRAKLQMWASIAFHSFVWKYQAGTNLHSCEVVTCVMTTKCKLYMLGRQDIGDWLCVVVRSGCVADNHMPSCVVTHARPPHEAMHARNLNMTNRSSLLLGTVERSKTLYICTYICMSSIFIRKTNPTTWRLSFLWVLLQQVKSLFRRGQAHLALGNFAAVTETLGCCGVVTRHLTSWKIRGYPATVVAQLSINMVILCNTIVYYEYC